MKFSSRVIALRNGSSFIGVGIIIKVETLGFIIGEVYINILQSIVNCIMTLKVEKSCWTAHGTYRSHKGNSFACIKESAGSTGLDGQICFLSDDCMSWLFWVRISIVLFTYFKKFSLSWRACIFAP